MLLKSALVKKEHSRPLKKLTMKSSASMKKSSNTMLDDTSSNRITEADLKAEMSSECSNLSNSDKILGKIDVKDKIADGDDYVFDLYYYNPSEKAVASEDSAIIDADRVETGDSSMGKEDNIVSQQSNHNLDEGIMGESLSHWPVVHLPGLEIDSRGNLVEVVFDYNSDWSDRADDEDLESNDEVSRLIYIIEIYIDI
jgi:hypothetical protein